MSYDCTVHIIAKLLILVAGLMEAMKNWVRKAYLNYLGM